MNRNQRRSRIKEDTRRLQKKGLSPKILDVKLVLLARQLVKILDHRDDANRVGEAALEAQKVLDLSLRNNRPAEALACVKGCNYCCHNFVSATVPQIFRIARGIRETQDMADTLERIRAIDEQTRNIERAQRYLQRQPCALLTDGACSVYGQRPTACRGMASFDVATCEKRVDGVHTPPAHELLRGLVDFAMMAALKVCDLPHEAYELNHAIRIALEMPDAEQRWLEGEDVFRGVMKDAWTDDPGISSNSFLDALVAATKGDAMDILDFQLP